MKTSNYFASFFIVIALCIFSSCKNSSTDKYRGWQVNGGTKEGTRYSSLTQVDTSNVQQLQVAWTYHTNDADTAHHSQIQCNPIIIDGILYGSTPQEKIFAINAATGREKWVFNPNDSAAGKNSFFIMNNIRGITNYVDDSVKRIFFTAGSYLHSLDANTGKPVNSFGNSGKVDLHDGLGRDVKDLFVTFTSPGIIYKDLIIIGSRVDEGPNAAPGHIRAYNVHTGKMQWIFHTIPQPGEPGYETWEDPNAWKHIGGANCWSGFTLDEKRGIVFASTGSASYDFYGGMRKGANLYADCILALDAATGKLKWHFQDVHHDLWDRDLPTPPALVTVTHNGKRTDAVVQPTKGGFVFLFDRETGQFLFDVKETSVPVATELNGEKIYPTQPIPVLPAPFVRQIFTAADINNLLPPDKQQQVKERLAVLKTGNMFNPPSKEGTVILPGYDGGAEWGGPGFDPSSGLLYVNASEMPWILQMVDAKNDVPSTETWLQAGQRLYNRNCMTCHGPERKGGGNYPSLINMQTKYTAMQFDTLLLGGRRMMPAFKQLHDEEINALASFVLNTKSTQEKKFIAPLAVKDSFLNLAYTGTGYNKFLIDGVPAIRPPWGTLNAINLNTGSIAWQIPLGQTSLGKSKGVVTGTENYGGPAVTAGGLIFIAATSDSKFRAFNKRTGKLLWETTLPACGFATPSIYELDGREYIVIACGGGKLNTTSGDAYVAFALPSK